MSEITTTNPLEVFLAFHPEEYWKVIESDTAPFIAPEKNPEWYVKQSELETAQARIAALSAENERLRKALIEASTRMKNARGAVESNQVADKDVHGTLTRGMFEIAEALGE